jgi:hypothetical protein
MAEVKVKITAQNEVRTGLQQALQETQKFGQQAKQAVSQGMTITPFKDDDGLGPLRDIQRQARELRELARSPIEAAAVQSAGGDLAQTSTRGASALRGLAADLATAGSAGEVFEAVVRRVSNAFGGLIAASAGFAVGTLIRRTLEDAAAGVEALIDRSQGLQNSFSALSSSTTTFGQLSSAIRGAAAEISGLEEANRKLQSGFGFQIADYLSTFDLSTVADEATRSGAANSRAALANAIQAATLRELELAKARTQEERDLIVLQAQREQSLVSARQISPQAEQRLIGLFAAQDQNIASLERLKAEQEISKEKEKQAAAAEREAQQEARRLADEQQRISKRRRDFDQQIALSSAKLRGDKAAQEDILQQQDVDRVLEGDGTTEQAAMLAASNSLQRQVDAVLASQNVGLSGSSGASALQRIGFASGEFFDARSKKDPAEATERAVGVAREILNLLKKGEPLVLPASS